MTKAQILFKQYCLERGMDDDDVRATCWFEGGLIEFADWILNQKCEQHNVIEKGEPLCDGHKCEWVHVSKDCKKCIVCNDLEY